MTKTDKERLAVLEQTTIEITKSLESISRDVKDIKNSLEKYATKEELEEVDNSGKSFMRVFFWPAQILSLATGGVLTFLLIEYIKNV